MAIQGLKGKALDLAVIGNCRTAGLTNTTGRLVWWCFPRFDSDPVFSRLVAGDEERSSRRGHGVRRPAFGLSAHTAIVQTTIETARQRIPLTDFTPASCATSGVIRRDRPPIERLRACRASASGCATSTTAALHIARDRVPPHPLRLRRRRSAPATDAALRFANETPVRAIKR